MPRNLALRILRGVLANIPTLFAGEAYWATDTNDLFIGNGASNTRLTLPAFNAAGARINQPHFVCGDVVLPSGGSTTVTLSGGAVFTASTSYWVSVSVNASKRTLQVVRNSGTSFTISGGGTGDIVSYICIGT